MTTYNITEVGTLTNNNGVISGFSSSDYAITPVTFNWGDNWELQIKFTYNDAGRTQTLIAPEENAPYGSILIIPNEWGNVRILLGPDNSSWNIFDSTVFNVSNGGTYWVKLSYNGSMYVCEYSDDGTTWTSTNLSSTISQLYGGLALRLGLEGYGNSNPWTGSIDLNECYVKINGTTVWEGASTPAYTGTHIQLRHDTASNWSTVNPTLLEGEVGFETDTNKFKFGDGISTYNSLNYAGGVFGNGVGNIIAITQTGYDVLINNSATDATSLYILTDTGAIYLGTTLIAQKN